MPPSNLSQSFTSTNFNTDDEDEDDDDADLGSPANARGKKANGKGGARAKKNGAGAAAAKSKDAKAAQHRKEQNRAAQREFRQRKQQYIRALEARVELLSSDHDTQVNRLRFALRHLLAENNTLRGMVGSLAHFIGKRSIGGCLVEAGMTREMLEATMNSSSEKVMSEAWANWPGADECEALKQIRKESNIPAEGLPESKLINYMRDVNSSKAAGQESSAASEAPASDRKKRTADDAVTKGSKRKRKTDESAIAATATGSNTTGTSPDESSPSTRTNAAVAGQAFIPTAQGMGTNDLDSSRHQQQQQQQQQSPYALPNQFWQPSPMGMGRQFRNDIDSTFAQTLLGGGNADLSSLASLFPSEVAMNHSLFSPSDATPFNGLVPSTSRGDGGSGIPDPNAASNFNFLSSSFGPSTLTFAQGIGASATGSAAAINSGQQHGYTVLMPSTASGGIENLLIPSSARMPPEHLRALRRRSARAIAQVNRIWAKRGATYFLNLPHDYQLDEDDVRYLEQQEASNPHIKLACIQLPNGWDEGDLGAHSSNKSLSDGSDAAATYDTENKADNFLRLSYHLNNYRLNPNYTLPSLLKPTPLQLSTPHDQALDSLPWPAIRDKLIQMPNIETHSVIIDLVRFLSPGDGDVHSEKNWVLTLPFFIRYPQLADATLLANTNAQRAARGEPEVTMDEVWKQHQSFQEYTQAKLKEL